MAHRVRPYVVGAAVAAAAVLAAARLVAGDFVGAIEDLPLMPELTEAADARVVFETPSGRIVQASATGTTTRERVWRFYDDTLPQLGWCRAGAGVFHREGETLIVEVGEGDGRAVTVRFTLEPGASAHCGRGAGERP